MTPFFASPIIKVPDRLAAPPTITLKYVGIIQNHYQINPIIKITEDR